MSERRPPRRSPSETRPVEPDTNETRTIGRDPEEPPFQPWNANELAERLAALGEEPPARDARQRDGGEESTTDDLPTQIIPNGSDFDSPTLPGGAPQASGNAWSRARRASAVGSAERGTAMSRVPDGIRGPDTATTQPDFPVTDAAATATELELVLPVSDDRLRSEGTQMVQRPDFSDKKARKKWQKEYQLPPVEGDTYGVHRKDFVQAYGEQTPGDIMSSGEPRKIDGMINSFPVQFLLEYDHQLAYNREHPSSLLSDPMYIDAEDGFGSYVRYLSLFEVCRDQIRDILSRHYGYAASITDSTGKKHVLPIILMRRFAEERNIQVYERLPLSTPEIPSHPTSESSSVEGAQLATPTQGVLSRLIGWIKSKK